MQNNNRVVLVDGANLFFSCYAANPMISSNGQPVGGILGFLKSLQKFCRIMNPDLIVIVWDGASGSEKRKKLLPEYKDNRKNLRLNRKVNILNEQQEYENRIWQFSRLCTEYINCLPIPQIMLNDVEADDTIAFLTTFPKFDNFKKIIISSDKDFLQLVSENVFLYRPSKKQIYNIEKVVEEYNIHPVNFAMVKAMSGDKSDNIEGIPRVGFVNAAKRFPFLVEDKRYSIENIEEFLSSIEDDKKSKLKVYENVKSNLVILKKNYELMQLYTTALDNIHKKEIEDIFLNFPYFINKTKFRKLIIEDSLQETNFDKFLAHLNNIVYKMNKRETK